MTFIIIINVSLRDPRMTSDLMDVFVTGDDDDVHDAGSVVIMDLAVFQEEGLKAQPQSVMAAHRMLGEGMREAKWVYVLLTYKF